MATSSAAAEQQLDSQLDKFSFGQAQNPNSTTQLLAEITPSFDYLRQHATVRVSEVGQYMSQRLR
jgi:hypothetical protein